MLRRRKRLLFLLVAGGVVILLALLFRTQVQRALHYAKARAQGKATVGMRVQQYGERARARLTPYFEAAGVTYPPDEVVLVGLKQEKQLEVYASGGGSPLTFVRSYPVLGTSGVLGPKLQQGDGQVPEGLYRIESLNPNSAFHLSLRVNYPNKFDRDRGREDGRSELGGDIMIHGDSVSIGCLAMGDEAAEDLFILAAESGTENVSVVLSPVDFRERELPHDLALPPWTAELYSSIRDRLDQLPPKDPPTTSNVAMAAYPYQLVIAGRR